MVWVRQKFKVFLIAFRHEKRTCYGGHYPNLMCTADEWGLIDKIVLVEQLMSFNEAVQYCQNEMNGQLWGDINLTSEELHVSDT